MSIAAVGIGSDRWNAQVYSGLALTAELAAGLAHHRPSFTALEISRLYRRLGKLNTDLDQVLKEYDQPVAFPADAPTEKIREGRDILLRLYADCIRLLDPDGGIPDRKPLVKRKAILHAQAERLLDVADWFDAMSDPEQLNGKFNLAIKELEEGGAIPWAAMR
jgi:hypothetical protein